MKSGRMPSRPGAGREVLLAELGAAFFIADLTVGVVMPTFSLYARSLNASLALVGLLAAFSAAVPLALSVPLGSLSDAQGRRSLLVGGILITGLACVLFTLVASPWQLIVPNLLFGLGTLATLSIGPAYVGDVLRGDGRRRGVAVYTIGMGSGYAAGAALAGYASAHVGFLWTYRAVGVLCIACGLIAYWRFRAHRPIIHSESEGTVATGTGELIPDRRLTMSVVGNATFNLSYAAALGVFLPIYAI